MSMSRRRFLAVVGAVSAATGLSPVAVARALENGPAIGASASLTTLGQTLRAGNVLRPGAVTDYVAVMEGPGEPHLVRADLAPPQDGREERRVSLVHLLHLTDQHITDGQSPLRLEFVRDIERDCETSDLPAKSAHRSHEVASGRIVDAMNARGQAISFSPVTGAPIQAAITTGDNVDNAQGNEIDQIIRLMNGGPVAGSSGAATYEGPQNSGDPAYWHPGGEVEDVLRRDHGFPVIPGFLDDALAPFDAVGVGVPWFTCYGNHDALVQGNFPLDRRALLDDLLVGDRKLVGLPPLPEGTNTCSTFGLFLGVAQAGGMQTLVNDAPTATVTADAERTFADRRAWVQAHLASAGLPGGHGLSAANLGPSEADSRLYYTADVGDVRWIVLDTTNPGGQANGSIGTLQLAWLEEELTRADREQRLVLLFSHHGLRSLDNTLDLSLVFTDDYDPNTIDPERRTASAVEAVVERHPCVIAWINGHSHVNIVRARDGFWDIGTAAHIDWPGQSRLVEVVDNRDGTLSILCTMVDHEGDGAHALAGTARELSCNEPLGGGRDPSGDLGAGTGQPEDRNVELLLTHPFPGVGRPTERASSRRVPAPVDAAGGLGAGPLGSRLSIAGALTVGAAVGIKRLRERAEHPASVTGAHDGGPEA
jgi:metallophosphoesterase (TIGR03767 family)